MWNRRHLQLWRDALAHHKVSEVESSASWAWRASLSPEPGQLSLSPEEPEPPSLV